ncbi:transposase [Bacillus cereus]|nr:hypothetical protein [Bacillus cereus]WHS75975.1 transposase [Bacillus cereus]
MGLFALLEYQFSQRIEEIGLPRFWRIDRKRRTLYQKYHE